MDFTLTDNAFFQNMFSDLSETGEISATQLLTISTQDLYKSENVTSMKTEGRFAAPLTKEKLEENQRNAVPKNTQTSNQWAYTVWKDWAVHRNQQSETVFEPGFPIPEDIASFRSFEEMDYWLQRFIYEIRRKNGAPYPPNTLTQITAALQRYLRDDKNIHVNFLLKTDPTFAGFRKALDSRMRQLTNEGIGVTKKSADPVTKEDESKMWETGVFSFDTVSGLSNAVFFYNGKVFGLRGGEEHINLLAEQFELGFDSVKKGILLNLHQEFEKMHKEGSNSPKKFKI